MPTKKTRSALYTDINSTVTDDGGLTYDKLVALQENFVASAVFDADLAAVAFSGDYNDLSNTPAGGGGATVDDTVYGVSWDAVTDEAPSKNVVYDKLELMQADIDGKLSAGVDVIAGTGLTGGGTLTGDVTVGLSTATQASLALADSALQSADVATVATTGSFNDLTDNPVSSIAYGISWSGDAGVPTKGVLYTKIEALDAAKANASHTHTVSEITDLTDYVEDVAGLTGSVSASALRTAINVADGAQVNAYASVAEIRTGTETAKAVTPDTLLDAGAPVTLTDGATITPNFAAGRVFEVTLGGNRTLAAPTNQAPGQSGAIFIDQDGTGNRTLSFNSAWKFQGGVDPTLSTAANATDMLTYYVRASGEIICSFGGGFA